MLFCKQASCNPAGCSKRKGGRSREGGRFIITAAALSASGDGAEERSEREFAHPKFAKFEELNLLGGFRSSFLPSSALLQYSAQRRVLGCVISPSWLPLDTRSSSQNKASTFSMTTVLCLVPGGRLRSDCDVAEIFFARRAESGAWLLL